MKRLFFDTEFTGLTKETQLISIGIIDEDCRTFYAELNDYDTELIARNKWMQENVIDNLIFNNEFEIFKKENGNISMKNTRKEVSDELIKWIGDEEVEFISDCNSYDHVLLVDLITCGGSALDMPRNISPYCHDINQDIARFYRVDNVKAFNMNREEIVDSTSDKKHNALKDAIDIKNIYEMIKGRKER